MRQILYPEALTFPYLWASAVKTLTQAQSLVGISEALETNESNIWGEELQENSRPKLKHNRMFNLNAGPVQGASWKHECWQIFVDITLQTINHQLEAHDSHDLAYGKSRTLQARPSYASKWILPGLYDPHPSSSTNHMAEKLIHDVWHLSLASIHCIVKSEFLQSRERSSWSCMLDLNLVHGSHEQPGTGGITMEAASPPWRLRCKRRPSRQLLLFSDGQEQYEQLTSELARTTYSSYPSTIGRRQEERQSRRDRDQPSPRESPVRRSERVRHSRAGEIEKSSPEESRRPAYFEAPPNTVRSFRSSCPLPTTSGKTGRRLQGLYVMGLNTSTN